MFVMMKHLLIVFLLLACNYAQGCITDFPVASMCQDNTVSGPEIVLDVSTAGITNYQSCECYLNSDEAGIQLVFDSKPNVTNCGNQLDLIFEDVGMQMKCGAPFGEQSTKGRSATIRYTKDVNATIVDSGYCLRFYSEGNDTKLVMNCEVSATTKSTPPVSVSTSTNTQPANTSTSASAQTTTQSSFNVTSVVNTTLNTTRNLISTTASTINPTLSTTTSIPSPTTLETTTLPSNTTNITNTTSSTQNVSTGASVPPVISSTTTTAISPNTSPVTTRVTFTSSLSTVSSLNISTTSQEITSSSTLLNSTTTKVSNLTEASDETDVTEVTSSTSSPSNNVTTAVTDTSSVSNVTITPTTISSTPNSTINNNNNSIETTTTKTPINTTTSLPENTTVPTSTNNVTITTEISSNVTKNVTDTPLTSTTELSSNNTKNVTDTPLTSTTEVSSNNTKNVTDTPLTNTTELSSNNTKNVTDTPLTSTTEIPSNVTNNVTDNPFTNTTQSQTLNTTELPENYTTSLTTVTDDPLGNLTGNDSTVTTPFNSNVTAENNSTGGNQTDEVTPGVTKKPKTTDGFWEPPINYPDDADDKPNNIVIILVPIAVVVLLCFVMAVAYVMCKRSKEALRKKSKEDELSRKINKETAAKIGDVKPKPDNPLENFVVSGTTNTANHAEEKYDKNKAKYETVNETLKADNNLNTYGNDMDKTVDKNLKPESKPQLYEPSERERDLLQSLELSTIIIEQDPDDNNRYFKKDDPGDWYRVIIKGKKPRDPNATLNGTTKSERKREKRKSRGNSRSNTSSSDDTKSRKKSRRSRQYSDLVQSDDSDHNKKRKTKSEENRRHSSIGRLQSSANMHDTVQSITRSINQAPTDNDHRQEVEHEPVHARVVVSKPVNNVPVPVKDNNSNVVLLKSKEQTDSVINKGDTKSQSTEQNSMFSSGRARNNVFGSSIKHKGEEANKRPDIVPPLDLTQSTEKSKKSDDFDLEEFDL